jgi:hypothetical protein
VVKYDRVADQPLINFATVDGPLARQICTFVWVKIFLDCQRDFKTSHSNVDPAAIDISLIDHLMTLQPTQIAQISGVGPQAQKKLQDIIEKRRDGKIFAL